jgi:hypothetical protein
MCINKPGNTFHSEYQRLSDDRFVRITRLGKRKIVTSLQHIQTNQYHIVGPSTSAITVEGGMLFSPILIGSGMESVLYVFDSASGMMQTTQLLSLMTVDSALALVFQEAIKKILILCAYLHGSRWVAAHGQTVECTRDHYGGKWRVRKL